MKVGEEKLSTALTQGDLGFLDASSDVEGFDDKMLGEEIRKRQQAIVNEIEAEIAEEIEGGDCFDKKKKFRAFRPPPPGSTEQLSCFTSCLVLVKHLDLVWSCIW